LYNRQLHDEDRDQATRLAALAKEKGLRYTEADIANQQALMDLTVDGKTYYGGNQVATGDKPHDGTDWNYYGQNVKGEPVWVQNVQRGDPDLQAFIVNNTNGKTANGMTYEATTTGSKPGLFRFPDFVNFQVDYFVGSAWGSFSRDGNSYFGYGLNKALPNSVNAAASAQFGWLNRSSVGPGETNKFLAGYAGCGTAAFSAVGGGVVYSPGNGTATVIGVGAAQTLGKQKTLHRLAWGTQSTKGKPEWSGNHA
jgi:filamentous hemagglutinin